MAREAPDVKEHCGSSKSTSFLFRQVCRATLKLDEIEHQMPSFRMNSLIQRVARHLLPASASNTAGCQNQFLDDIVLYVPNPRWQAGFEQQHTDASKAMV